MTNDKEMTNDQIPMTNGITGGAARSGCDLRYWSLVIGIWSLVILLALAFRLAQLDLRPMHCDEANQAVRTGRLQASGEYRYDPQEHHGPTLYWFTLPVLWLRGAPDLAHAAAGDFRLLPALGGVGLILLLPLVADGLGRTACLIAGLLAAVSPAMVYYSRDYIQETLLVLFTFAAIAAGWRYVRRPSAGWAAALGAALGLMHATKETWVLAAAAMLAALVVEMVWTRVQTGRLPPLSPLLRPAAAIAFAAAAALVVITLYTSFGKQWRGPLDSLLAYANYVRKAGGNEVHSHGWHYYLQLLVAYRPQRGFFWSEGLIVGLAALGAVWSLGGRPALARFLAVYCVVLTALYSAIPYKTPWCLLSFLQAMTLLAGVGAAALLGAARSWPLRIAIGLALLVGVAHLGKQCYALNYRFYSDPRNPYAYAETSTDVRNLAERMRRLAERSPDGRHASIHVLSAETYWPLPWYLRQFDAVGYWTDPGAWAAAAAAQPPPAAILFTADMQAAVDAGLRAEYNKQMSFGLRPGELYFVYVREDLWPAVVE